MKCDNLGWGEYDLLSGSGNLRVKLGDKFSNGYKFGISRRTHVRRKRRRGKKFLGLCLYWGIPQRTGGGGVCFL